MTYAPPLTGHVVPRMSSGTAWVETPGGSVSTAPLDSLDDLAGDLTIDGTDLVIGTAGRYLALAGGTVTGLAATIELRVDGEVVATALNLPGQPPARSIIEVDVGARLSVTTPIAGVWLGAAFALSATYVSVSPCRG